MTELITDQQLDGYEAAARNAAAIGSGIHPDTTIALVAEVRRLQQQRRVLLASIARKDARTGEGDKALREFLATPEENPRPEHGSTRTGCHTATVAITITAPTDENANAWAETLYDHVHAEYGDEMRLDISVNPPTLARHGDWKVTRGGVIVYTAATRAEAQAVGAFAIRQETNHPEARIEWVCPACVDDDQYCQDCSDDTQWYLYARGVWTEADYAVERVPAARSAAV